MYSYDRNRFCFLPATTHFNTDPDFSFSALCTLSQDSLIVFNNEQVVLKAIQSDLAVDPIAYRTISTNSIVDPILYTSSTLICCHPSSRIAGTVHICYKATDIYTTIREDIYTFRRATDISTTI